MALDKDCLRALANIRGLAHLPEKRLRALIRITFGRRLPEKLELLAWAIENGLYETRCMEVASKVLATLEPEVHERREYLN